MLELEEDSAQAARSPTPVVPLPTSNPLLLRLREKAATHHECQLTSFERFESTKPAVSLPPLRRLRKADTKVPRHKNRVYVRSEVSHVTTVGQ